MRLGQHFLINKNKLRKIAEALDLKAGDVAVEIGPGHGELTNLLIAELQNCKIARLIAIEKDQKLAEDLRNRIYDLRPNVEIVTGDVLKILKSYTLNLKSYKLVGNIPYYITGHLFRIIGELKNKPALIVLTIQKEVAERVCAEPPQMNLLAASVQFWAEPKIISPVSKKDFRPAPKVDSAIIKLVIKKLSNYVITQLPNYYRLIKILFKQPRKTIINNLMMTMTMTITKDEVIKQLRLAGINPQDRPQNLSIEQLLKLTQLF